MFSNENDKHILEEIAKLRKEIAQKADKSAVEQISSYQDEIDNLKLTNANRLDTLERKPDDPEFICQKCIDNDDMETAFLTVLKFIETISSTKAESRMVDNKASKKYVESLFGHLNVITGQQITEANQDLRETLEVKLNSLSKSFDNFSRNITRRVESIESEVTFIEDFIVRAKQATQTKLEKERREKAESGEADKERINKLKSISSGPLMQSKRLKKALKSSKDMNFVISNLQTTQKRH